MTLPTRESARDFAERYSDVLVRGKGMVSVVKAYGDGDLLSRAEWEATIDYTKGYTAAEAELGRQIGDIEDVDSAAICDAFVDAAVGERNNDE